MTIKNYSVRSFSIITLIFFMIVLESCLMYRPNRELLDESKNLALQNADLFSEWAHGIHSDTHYPVMQINHLNKINSVSFSPDGKYALSGSSDNTVKLWNITSGQLIITMKGHEDEVTSTAFSSNGKYALSGSWDTKIILWDIATGKKIHILEGHTGGVRSVSFSPDSQYILSGSWDKTIKLWDRETGQNVRTMEGHSESVTSVTFSYNNQLALSGSEDKTIKLWNILSGELLKTIEEHKKGVTSVAFSPDGKYIISGSLDKKILIWDIEKDKLIRTMKGHKKEITSVVFSPDGLYAMSGSLDKKIKIWNVGTGELIKTLKGHEEGITSVAYSPDGQFALSGSIDKILKLWEMPKGKLIRTIGGPLNEIYTVALSKDALYFLTGSDDSTITLWDTTTGQLLRIMEGHKKKINSVAISSDSRYVLSGSEDKKIKIWDLETGKLIKTLGSHTKAVTSVIFSPDGDFALSGSEDKKIKLWNLSTKKLIRTMTGHTGSVNSVAFSPDGQYALSGSDDDTIKIWDTETGEVIRTIEGHRGNINAVAFSPDGQYILSGSWDNTIKLWNMETGQLVQTLIGHSESVTSVAFSPDGLFILSGSLDKTLILWNTATGKLINTMKGHNSSVNAITFTPDNQNALSVSKDGTQKYWSIPNCKLIYTALKDSNGESLVWTPEGYFEGGTNLIEKTVIIVNGLTSYPIDQFSETYNRPDIIKKIIAGEKIMTPIYKKPIENSTSLTARFIDPVYSTKEKQVNMLLEISLPEEEIEDLFIYINGLLYKSSASRGISLVQTDNVKTTKLLTLDLIPGKNRIEINIVKKGKEEKVSLNHTIEADYIEWDFTEVFPPEYDSLTAKELLDRSQETPSLSQRASLRSYLAIHRGNTPEGLVGKAWLAGANGNDEKEMDYYSQAINLDPQLDLAIHNLAVSYQNSKNKPMQIKTLEIQLKYNHEYQDFFNIYWMEIILRQEQGEYTANNFLNKWKEKLGTDHPIFYEIAGRKAASNRNFSEAERLYSLGCNSSNSYYRLHKLLIDLQLNHTYAGKSGEAKLLVIKEFSRQISSLENKGNINRGYMYIGDKYYSIFTDYGASASYYIEAFKIFPTAESVNMIMNRGTGYFYDDEIKQYIDQGEQLLQYDAEMNAVLSWHYSDYNYNSTKAIAYQIKAIRYSHTKNDKIDNLYFLKKMYEDLLFKYDEAKQLCFVLPELLENKEELYKSLFTNRYFAGDLEEAKMYLDQYREELGKDTLWQIRKRDQLERMLYLKQDKQEIVLSMSSALLTANLSVSPSENIFASGYNPLSLWDIESEQKIMDLGPGGHELAFSPDGNYIATIDHPNYEDLDYTIYVYNRKTGNIQFQIPTYETISNLVWAPDSKRIAVNDDSGNVSIFDVIEKRKINRFRMGSTRITGPMVWLSKDYFVTGQAQMKELKVWDKNFNMIKILKGIDWPHALGRSYDGRYLICSDNAGKIAVWDTTNWDLRTVTRQPFASKRIYSHPNEYKVLMDNFAERDSAKEYGLTLFNLQNMKIEANIEGKTGINGGFSPDGTKIYSESYGQTVFISDSTNLEVIDSFYGAAPFPHGMVLDTQSNYLMTTNFRGTDFWDLYSGQKVHHEDDELCDTDFNSNSSKFGDGLQIAESQYLYFSDYTAFVYNVANFTKSEVFNYNVDFTAVAVSDSYIVLGGWDSKDKGSRGKAKSEKGIGVFEVYDKQTFKQITQFSSPLATEFAHFEVYSPKVLSIAIDDKTNQIYFNTSWEDGWGTDNIYSDIVQVYSLEGKLIEHNRADYPIYRIQFNSIGELEAIHKQTTRKFINNDWKFKNLNLYNEISLVTGHKIYWQPDMIKYLDKTLYYSDRIISVAVDEGKNILIVLLIQNEIRFYDLENFQEQLILGPRNDNEWIALTPGGEYIASENGTDKINWNINGKLLPLKSLSRLQENPLLVQERLESIYNNSKEKLISELQLPVSINELYNSYRMVLGNISGQEIIEDYFNLNLSIQKLNEAAQNPEIKIFINNRLIPDEQLTPLEMEYTTELRVLPGHNTVKVELYYQGIKLEQDEFTVFYRPQNYKKPDLYFLGFGISEYQQSSQNLAYADKDVEAISLAFKGQEGIRYNNVYTKILTNSNADNNAIENALDNFLKNAGEEDIVVIFLAGHGIQNSKQELYYVTYKADMRYPESGFPLSKIQEKLQSRPLLQRVVLALDICHSGAGIPKSKNEGHREIDSSQAAYNLTKELGVVYLSSSTGRQFSYESKDFRGGHGAFTAAIIDAFQNEGDLDNNGIISIKELAKSVIDGVVEYTEGNQIPVSNVKNIPDYDFYTVE